MANGDMFIPDILPFELYKTHISYGHNKARVTTDVISIKCAINKAQLMREFFSNSAILWNSTHASASLFLPA